MPKPVSKKQLRYMMAILSHKPGASSRGDRVPDSIAEKYKDSGEGSDLPESKGKEHEGGKWTDTHHEKHSKKEREKKLHKALAQFVTDQNRRAASIMVCDGSGKILIGRRTDNGLWTLPGGHLREGESMEDGARRETLEESGVCCGTLPLHHLCDTKCGGVSGKVFTCIHPTASPKDSNELVHVGFRTPDEISKLLLVDFAQQAVNVYSKIDKSMTAEEFEELQKNIVRSNGPSDVVYDMTHGDALRLVGTGTFRFLRDQVKDMGDEDFKNITFDTCTIHIRKHTNDIYSGRVIDGHKVIHQFVNRSLPQIAADLMSLFEWYSPEDEMDLENLASEHIPDDAIEGGMRTLVDNYRRHNLANIYDEMENVRQEIRNGMAIDIQQVEQRMMKLFDRLEAIVMDSVGKHNTLARDAGSAIDELEAKLRELYAKIDELSKKPVSVEAIAPNPAAGAKVHDEYYSYLPRPTVEIEPNGKIRITFASDWTDLERSNFLNDMKAKILTKRK